MYLCADVRAQLAKPCLGSNCSAVSVPWSRWPSGLNTLYADADSARSASPPLRQVQMPARMPTLSSGTRQPGLAHAMSSSQATSAAAMAAALPVLSPHTSRRHLRHSRRILRGSGGFDLWALLRCAGCAVPCEALGRWYTSWPSTMRGMPGMDMPVVGPERLQNGTDGPNFSLLSSALALAAERGCCLAGAVDLRLWMMAAS